MKITSNGNKKITNILEGSNSGTSIIYVSGVDGGAVLGLVYANDFGDFIPMVEEDDVGDMVPMVLESGQQYKVEHGIGVQIYAAVTNASGSTNLSVISAGKA